MDLKNFSEDNIPYSKNSMAYGFILAFVNSKKGLTYLKKDVYYESICKTLVLNWTDLSSDSKDLMKLALRVGRVNSRSIRKILSDSIFTTEDQVSSLKTVLNKLNKLFNLKYNYILNTNIKYKIIELVN